MESVGVYYCTNDCAARFSPYVRIEFPMASTLEDIAKKAGVSVSTVSRILNKKTKKYRISPKTESLVLKLAKGLNYTPNQLARGLRLKRTHSIGLIVPDISNPFFAAVTRAVQRAAHEMGYSLMVCDTDEDESQEIAHIKVLRSKGVDGMVVMPVGQSGVHLQQLIKDGLPLVVLDRIFDDLPCDSVVIDNYKGAYEAVEYLVKNGHARIAIIQGLPNTYTNKGRLSGYRDALKANNIELDPRLIVGRDFRQESGYIETKILLSLEPRPTAIFATSDLITLGALEAINEEGLHIPQDLSLIAFDDIDHVNFFTTPLTTISQPKEIIGEVAIKLLTEKIKNHNKGESRRIMLSSRLVERNSVRSLLRPQVVQLNLS